MASNNRCLRMRTALLVLCSGGAFGVLYDLDHILVLWARGLPITLDNLMYKAGRPLHIPILLVCSAACFVCGALLAGQAFMVKKNGRRE